MGHGDHWQAVDQDVDMYIQTMVPLIYKEGERVGENTFSHTLEEVEKKDGVVFGLQYPDLHSPVSFLALVVSQVHEEGDLIWTAYPVCAEGPCTRLVVDEVKQWGNGIEAAIETYMPEGDSFCFYDPFYYLNKEKYQEWAEIDVALSALAYVLEKAEPEEDEPEEGEQVEGEQQMAEQQMAEQQKAEQQKAEQQEGEPSENTPDEMLPEETIVTAPGVDCDLTGLLQEDDENPAEYFPCGEKGDSAEIEFIVEEAIPVACIGRLFWRMTGVIMRADNAGEMRIHVYASEHVLKGYIPQPGDDVLAVAWMQGRLLRVVESA